MGPTEPRRERKPAGRKIPSQCLSLLLRVCGWLLGLRGPPGARSPGLGGKPPGEKTAEGDPERRPLVTSVGRAIRPKGRTCRLPVWHSGISYPAGGRVALLWLVVKMRFTKLT